MFIIIIWINGVEKKGERESGGWEWGEGGGRFDLKEDFQF